MVHGLCEASALGLRGADEAEWVGLLTDDWANVREALRRALLLEDFDHAVDIVAHLVVEGIWRRPELVSWCGQLHARFG